MIVLLVLFGVLVLVAAIVVAVGLQRRARPDAPTQPLYTVPAQLDRKDFERPDAPWLVAVFTSASCRTCQGAVDRSAPLASSSVAVQEVEVGARGDLHDRYAVEAVPMILVVDAAGVVRASFLGVPATADLWAAVADVRSDG